MIQQLGVMLCKEREKTGETQKNIAEGIISISELSRVERGEHEVDYFMLQALFERLGKSIDKMELAVSVSEYEAISYRVEIEHSIDKRDCEMLAKLIAGYGAYNDKKRPIHRQYAAMLQAVLCYIREQDYAACQHRLEHALTCTLSGDWVQRVSDGQRLCNQEIQLILMIVYCQWKQADTHEQIQSLTEQMEQFSEYIWNKYTDGEEQVKVYPLSAWLLGELCLYQDRVADAYVACDKGKKCLRENGALNPALELLALEAVCLEKMGMQAELERSRKHSEAIVFLYEAAGSSPEPDMLLAFMKSSFQGEFVITNELLRDLRKARGLSQEALCMNVCSQETLSRIEQGKRRPNKKRLYQMLKRLGMDRENYYGFIEADDYGLYEKVRQFNRCFTREGAEFAMKLLDEIEGGVDMTLPINRQFVEEGRITWQLVKGSMSREQANRQLAGLLCLTMPPAESGERYYRVPFRTEYMLINHMAINLRNDNRVQEAVDMFEELMKCFKRSRVRMRHHAVSAFMLYINMAAFLEVYDRLDRAEEIAREGLLHNIECCRGDISGDILANLSVVYWKRGQPELEEAYLRNAYYLKDFYGREADQYKLVEAYRDKFHKEIDSDRGAEEQDHDTAVGCHAL